MENNVVHRPTFAERYPITLIAAFADMGLTTSASFVAYYIRFQHWQMPANYYVATFSFSLLIVFCMTLTGVYSSWRGKNFLKQILQVYTGWLIAIGAILSISVYLKISSDYSRTWFTLAATCGMALSTMLRIVAFLFLRAMRLRGRNLKQVILVGEGGSVANTLNHGRDISEFGFFIVDSIPFQQTGGWLDDLANAVSRSSIHEVWLCLSLKDASHLNDVVYALRHSPVAIRFFPDLADFPLLNHKISQIAGQYSIDISCSPMYGIARFIKRTEDIILGLIISALVAPVCLLIAIAVKLDSPGPVLFKQYRTGINGKKFKVYKFRTMVVHKEKDGKVTQAKKSDPRVTRLGAFLRCTSLDELPQFFNVLQGRMSIVGPRPHALAHNEHYMELVESYMQRHQVKPGITGWAQVNGFRGETDTLYKMKKRVEHDLWYIDNWSLWLDLKIIAQTVIKGFTGNNAY